MVTVYTIYLVVFVLDSINSDSDMSSSDESGYDEDEEMLGNNHDYQSQYSYNHNCYIINKHTNIYKF